MTAERERRPFAREMLCDGRVTHRRTHPVMHAFAYRVWMVLVDVDRIEAGCRPPWLRRLASWDRGHLLSREQVMRRLALAHIDVRPTRILALTQPRSAGFSFNPVNFYFCYSRHTCEAILSDVRNTPWNERHCYALDARDHVATETGLEGDYRFRPAKRLHVSPFMPMRGDYRWRFRMSAERIHITMHFDPHGRPAFTADLKLRTRPLTTKAVLGAALRMPAQNLATLLRIYWQAGRLFLKRAPFHAHPAKGRPPH